MLSFFIFFTGTILKFFQSEFEILKNSLKGKKIAIFADETTDCEQRFVLNVLILELDFAKAISLRFNVNGSLICTVI